jgi:hypothetical protein
MDAKSQSRKDFWKYGRDAALLCALAALRRGFELIRVYLCVSVAKSCFSSLRQVLGK